MDGFTIGAFVGFAATLIAVALVSAVALRMGDTRRGIYSLPIPPKELRKQPPQGTR